MLDGERIKLYIESNIGRIIGVIIGLIFGILVLSLGFWRSILLFIFIGAGYWIGNRVDNGKRFHSVFNKSNKNHNSNW